MPKKDKIEKIINIVTFIVLSLVPVVCAWMGMPKLVTSLFGMFFAFLSFFVFCFLGSISLVKKYALFFLGYSGIFLCFVCGFKYLLEDSYDITKFFWRMICFSWYACLVWFFFYAIYWVGKTLFGTKE